MARWTMAARPGSSGADLSIGADGELTLEDATFISSGDITFTNDPDLTDDDFPREWSGLLQRPESSWFGSE